MNSLGLIFITVLASCATEKLIDYRLNRSPTAELVKNCTKAGTLCETCSSLVACVENPDHTWVKSHLATCDAPSYCVDGACTTDPDPFCDGRANYAFPCQRVGVFPDPFYCNKFNLCIKDSTSYKSYLNKCEDGYGFNIENDLCDIPLTNGECQEKVYPVPLCTEAGDSAALEEKPAMYYLCKEYSTTKSVLYPYLDVCPGGKHYVNYECGGTGTSGTPTPPTTVAPPL